MASKDITINRAGIVAALHERAERVSEHGETEGSPEASFCDGKAEAFKEVAAAFEQGKKGKHIIEAVTAAYGKDKKKDKANKKALRKMRDTYPVNSESWRALDDAINAL